MNSSIRYLEFKGSVHAHPILKVWVKHDGHELVSYVLEFQTMGSVFLGFRVYLTTCMCFSSFLLYSSQYKKRRHLAERAETHNNRHIM